MLDSSDRGSAIPQGQLAFPIVAIGASAGGLEALRQLFSQLPSNTGMAFVVIQHLDPNRASMLSNVLTSDAQMPVVEVTEGTPTEPNHVYVIPPGADLTVRDGAVVLVPRLMTGKVHLPIDVFFRALAADVSRRAIGVVLSGCASDGTEGLRAIKCAGGIALVQEPHSAQFRSMPESAIAAEVCDFRGLPEELARELVRLSQDPYLAPGGSRETASDEPRLDDLDGFQRILTVLRRSARLDFSGYKRPTIVRRIQRRMALRQSASLSAYATTLREDPAESMALAEDILIHVTSFFRDPAAFEALEQRVFPELLAHKAEDAALRIWVPGCATGQEAYSLAICLTEFLAKQARGPAIKIFGTDLSERAIEVARLGQYGEADLEGLGQERVSRFFERVGGRYRIGRQIRELCIFVRHDLTRDPPFAKLDLISCRNVLIYFDTDLQRRVLPMLHHCLNQPGYLLLGSSEGIREFQSIFPPLDKDQRIYTKAGDSPRMEYPVSFGRDAENKLVAFQPTQLPQPARDARRQADHVLLSRYAPAGVVVNERFEVIEFRGRIGGYLEPAPGQPQVNVLKMARDGIYTPLREALETAVSDGICVRKDAVRISDDMRSRFVNLEVIPLSVDPAASGSFFLVVFEEQTSVQAAARNIPDDLPSGENTTDRQRHDQTVARLRAELLTSKEYLRALTVEHQDAIDELGAANEELTAANEELQSTNEELQSAKEELQSTNEELLTLNEEISCRNRELDSVANDLLNVLESVQVPMIMVDQTLRIRRFTPSAREISSLLPSDVGRPIDDVKFKVSVEDLITKIRETMESICSQEYEVQAQDGRWYRLSIRPYRTTDRRLDGAILSFFDIDVLKLTALAAERARDYAQSVVDTVPVSLVVLDKELNVVSANPPFCKTFALGPNATSRTNLFELAARALDTKLLREATERSVRNNSTFRELEFLCVLPEEGQRNLLVAGSPVEGQSGEPMLLLAFDDVTERRLLEASEKRSRIDAERANRAKDLFLATLSHELRTPLGTILMSSQLLQRIESSDSRVQRASTAIERAVRNQARLIDDLLDISRIVSGKLTLSLQPVNLCETARNAIDVVQALADAKQIDLRLDVPQSPVPVDGDPMRLLQAVTNLLNNSLKFTAHGGKIGVNLETAGGHAQIAVNDTGIGLRPEVIPHIFDRFVQAEASLTRTNGGLGLGLAIVRHIVNVHSGEVRAESPGEGLGATFTITLPLASRAIVRPKSARTVVPDVTGVRVLLIEDDDDTRDAYSMMLQEQGAEAHAVSSALQGLSALEHFVPQVILCDIAMPGEDGYSFIRKLRSKSVGNAIPAIAFTALASDEDRTRSRDAGFQLHLAKPVGCEELTMAIAALTRPPRQSSSPPPASSE